MGSLVRFWEETDGSGKEGREGICVDCRVDDLLDIDGIGDAGVFRDDAGYPGEFPDGGGAESVFGGGERGVYSYLIIL